MNDKVILIDTNILFDILSSFQSNKFNLSKFKIKRIIKVQKLFKDSGKYIKIPDIVINEFSARFFNIMEIEKERKILSVNDYKQWIKLQNSAWQQIISFIFSNKSSIINFSDFKDYGYNIFNLALEITRFELPKGLRDAIIKLSERDPYSNITSGKLFDGLDSLILSYVFIMALENPEKKVEFITNDNYFKLGANYFLKNNLPIMDKFKYPSNLIIKGV